MDKETIKGSLEQLKGKTKEVAGRITGDTQLQTEGKLDQAEGAARKAVGNTKDSLRKAVR